MRTRAALAAVVLALLLPCAPAQADGALEVKWLGRKCRPNGNTVALVKITNTSDKAREPGYFFNYTDTGMETGGLYVAANDSIRLRAVIPAGRTIKFLGVYRSYYSNKVIWEREKIKALDCPTASEEPAGE